MDLMAASCVGAQQERINSIAAPGVRIQLVNAVPSARSPEWNPGVPRPLVSAIRPGANAGRS